MASAPATVQYKMPSGGNLKKLNIGGGARGGRQFLNWTQTRAPKNNAQLRQEAADRLKRTRPLAALNQRVSNAQHDNDMSRIGAGKPEVTGTLNPGYAGYKNNALQYNSALSRQQLAQRNNPVIQTITPTRETATEKFPAPITKYYVPRGGSSGRTPSSEALKVLNKEQPNIQVV